jgi:hypothetical protein
MDIVKTVTYWLESSEYDLDTGAILLRSKNFRMHFSLVTLRLKSYSRRLL